MIRYFKQKISTANTWLLAEVPTSPRHSRCQNIYLSWLKFSKNPIAMVGALIIIGLIMMAIFAPWIASNDGTTQVMTDRLKPPSAEYWFGTDEIGRSIFNRIIYGSRYTLYIVFLVSIIIMPIGMVVGIVSGYSGGKIDTFLMRLTDIFLAFPRLVLALAFVAGLGPGLEKAVLAIALTAWAPYARLARAETLMVRKSEYIEAAQLSGTSSFVILYRHITPMCMSSIIIRLTLDMSGIILSAAALGFLGLGAQPPTPEWGAMISTGRDYMLDQWWLAGVPGIAILIVSMGFNLLGDGLRDILDPRSEVTS
jgi:peptide/nickel transport system permease protein